MKKEHLMEYRSICAEIHRLEDEHLKWTARAERCTRAPSQAPALGGVHDPMPLIVDKLTELREEAARQAGRLYDARRRIERAIEALPSDQRRVMRARYIEGKDWLTVAHEMSFCEAHVFRLHNKALISMKFIHSKHKPNKNKRTISMPDAG